MNRPGYWPSTWPVEGGGNHRPKTVLGPALNVQPTDRLVATVRHTGRRPVMFIQRDRGELFLQGTTTTDDPKVAGWVERVDPVTLEPLARSGDLPAGGHQWPGSIAAHANGSLYTVNGSYIHRLDEWCSVVVERELPVDQPHDGLLILDDGSIMTKDVQLGDTPSTITVLDPDLNVLASTRLAEPSAGRLAVGEDGYIYVPGSTTIFRFSWFVAGAGRDPVLIEDRSWSPVYRKPGHGGVALDTTISRDRVWFMDNGRLQSPDPLDTAGTSWTTPVYAVGVSIDRPDDVIKMAPTEQPAGWVTAPPLVHGNTVVAWDTGNMGVAAFDVSGGSTISAGDMLWFQPFRPSMQPLLFADTHELIINDFRMLDENETSDDLVVLDVRTGQMKARVPTGATSLDAMFLCPGWDRDVYYCSPATVARIRVESL